MVNKAVVVLDIFALLLTAIWTLRSIVIGLSNADLIYNYLYVTVVSLALIITLFDEIVSK